MAEDRKKSIQNALLRHHEKAANRKKPGGVRRKNGKPEQLVVKAILEWAKSEGLDLHVVESKAVYHPGAARYLHSMTSESLSDLVGNYRGLSVWIEAKAEGRVSTLKEHQRAFLARKAIQGCFATCVDSVPKLDERFKTWLSLPENEKTAYLLGFLKPKDKHIDEKDLF